MARKKKPRTFKQLTKDKRLRRAMPLLLLLLGMAIGSTLVWLQPPDVTPKNMVWVAGDDVEAPPDLVEFLRNQDACSTATNSRSVGLWGIYQTSKKAFAKVSYGCSTNLTSYMMAVKVSGTWQLLKPSDYFAAQSTAARFLPNCQYIDKYKIDSSIEPFCIEDGGQPRENMLR